MSLPDIPEPANSGGNFLILKDQESVRAVFIGPVHYFYIKKQWVGGKSVMSNEADPDAKIRIRSNLVISETNGLVVKIWEFAYPVFKDLKTIEKELKESGIGINEIKIKITRDKVGPDTKYQLMALTFPKDMLTKSQIHAINAMPLHDLEKKTALPSGNKPSDGEELPF